MRQEQEVIFQSSLNLYLALLSIDYSSTVRFYCGIWICVTSAIQFTYDESRLKASGLPEAQRTPHERTPTNRFLIINGPPESPTHVPCPILLSVHKILSCIMSAKSPARSMHSSRVIVNTVRYRSTLVVFRELIAGA